jgi:3-hydroxyisobutyrate dehydrogenase-like beta-hydroxyacid dehydrogenase
VIDAPVSGATQAAADAQLLIMAGCREAEATTLMPIFDALGRRTMFLGAVGTGTVMKLAVNSVLHGLNQALAEAMSLATAAGIPPEATFDVIENSAPAAPMLKYRRPLYLNEAAHDVTFTVALARKYMEVTAALAERVGATMPQGRVTLDNPLASETQEYGVCDMATMIDFIGKDKT